MKYTVMIAAIFAATLAQAGENQEKVKTDTPRSEVALEIKEK